MSPSRSAWFERALTGLAMVLGFSAAAWAAPFVPTGDDVVVERLPLRIGSAAERQQERRLRAALRNDPQQLSLAVQLARASIERARALGDPRELGQAQAALTTWWSLTDPPPAVRLMRATVRQATHDFAAALNDLDALLVDPQTRSVPLPVRAQAELTRASVLQVTGRWAEATAACQRLAGEAYVPLGASVMLPARACLAELDSLQGQASRGSAALAVLAREEAAAGGGQAAWLALVRAELAERQGSPTAESLYRQALQPRANDAAQRPPDVYTLAAYADWLLARKRPAEVSTLLAGREEADALLLRLAIAWRDSGDPKAAQAIRTLGARFEAAAQRGDASHGREQARYELDLMNNPAAALKHAQANWATQREPGDALILLRAARAASDTQAAEPVLQHVRASGLQDVRLQALMAPPPKPAS